MYLTPVRIATLTLVAGIVMGGWAGLQYGRQLERTSLSPQEWVLARDIIVPYFREKRIVELPELGKEYWMNISSAGVQAYRSGDRQPDIEQRLQPDAILSCTWVKPGATP